MDYSLLIITYNSCHEKYIFVVSHRMGEVTAPSPTQKYNSKSNNICMLLIKKKKKLNKFTEKGSALL